MQMLRNFYIGGAGALGLTLFAFTAQAAPAAGIANLQADAAQGGASIEKVAYRRCWIRYGVRNCRWVDDYNDDYGYYDGYGYGDAYGPGGFGLSFGGGHGHFRGHHR
jgi:hypothetical protein